MDASQSLADAAEGGDVQEVSGFPGMSPKVLAGADLMAGTMRDGGPGRTRTCNQTVMSGRL